MSLDPALRTLLRLKLKGLLRRQWRRLRTPKGAALSLLGLALLGLWLFGMAASFFLGTSSQPDPLEAEGRVRLGGFFLLTITLSSALSHRGLSVPKEEIERLFAAPLARAQIVRYRLGASLGRALFGGLVLGIVVGLRMPRPLFGFCGVVLSLLTLPVVGQLLALALGALEHRFAERLRHVGRVLAIGATCALVFLVLLILGPGDLQDVPVFGDFSRWFDDGSFGDPLSHPVFLTLTTPFVPFARMIAAEDAGAFVGWAGVVLALALALVELTARLGLDYRELSLETSASVAARLRRVRSGGGAASGRVSRRLAGWSVPWLFGRGPAGAVAWRKTAALVRRSRGTLGVSAAVLLFLTLITSTTLRGEEQDRIAPFLVGFLGTLYLCAGLRFDFRNELDRMEVLRAWPVAPSRLFTAMLLPQALFVTVVLELAVALRIAVGGVYDPVFAGLVLGLPLIVFAWIALDNAVFLVAPVRVLPGQEGALQNAGRGVVMMLTRFTMMGLIGGLGFGLGGGTWFVASELLGWTRGAAVALASLVVLVGLVVVDLALVWLGGKALRAFDVARDRG